METTRAKNRRPCSRWKCLVQVRISVEVVGMGIIAGVLLGRCITDNAAFNMERCAMAYAVGLSVDMAIVNATIKRKDQKLILPGKEFDL